MNTTYHHYKEKPYIQLLLRGRPSTPLSKFYQIHETYFDKLLNFVNQDSPNNTISTDDIACNSFSTP
jgi:hypothetical protein